MKVFLIWCLWIQATLAQFNTPLQSGCGLQQNFPNNNLPVNQLPLNNGVPLRNVINRQPIGNQPVNLAPNVLANIPANLPSGLPNNLPNLPVTNRLPNLPQQNVPVTNYENLPRNRILNNIPVQNNYGNLQLGNLPVNNIPYNNLRVTNLPVGNLPIGNNNQLNNLPLSNNVPVNNLQSPNNFNMLLNSYVNNPQRNLAVPNVPAVNNLQLLNNLPAVNSLQIPNNVQIPLVNNAQYNLLAGNLPVGNSLVSPNYLQGFANNAQLANLPVNYNVPNNLPIVNYNLPNVQQNLANTNYLANINNLQSPNSVSLNNLQLANLNVPNNVQISNRVPVNNLYNGQIASTLNYVPNNLPANVGQTLSISLAQPSLGSQYLPVNSQNLQLNQPTSVSFGNDCGCKANAMFLLDDKVANALPSTPVLSLNGLQLEGLRKLPLFNGLPVIGMTESIVNLNSI